MVLHAFITKNTKAPAGYLLDCGQPDFVTALPPASSIFLSYDVPLVEVRDNDKVPLATLPAHPKLAEWITTLGAHRDLMNATVIEDSKGRIPSTEAVTRRIFSRSSYRYGGRLYSPIANYSQRSETPEESALRLAKGGKRRAAPLAPHGPFRSELRFNGEATVEVDFTAIHPVLLFAAARVTCPRDPYQSVADETGLTRDEVKKTLTKIINADPESLDEPSPKWRKIIGAPTLGPVRRYFGKNAGIRFQNLDSTMMMATVQEMVTRGLPIVTIHDSAIVRRSDLSALIEALQKGKQAMIEASADRKGGRPYAIGVLWAKLDGVQIAI